MLIDLRRRHTDVVITNPYMGILVEKLGILLHELLEIWNFPPFVRNAWEDTLLISENSRLLSP